MRAAADNDVDPLWEEPTTEPRASVESPWPREFGRYILLSPLAQGGMGDVCLALSGTLTDARRLCVLKTVRSEYAGERDFIDRFLDEGKVLCALSHPNIAQVIEVGIQGPTPFVAMEYVAGVDLDAVVYAARASGQKLPLDFVLATLAGMLDGMAYAHRAKALDGSPLHLVHRDLSPQNVRVSWEGDVKVLDFGTAHAAGRAARTAHGLVFGKPGYMSPEQSRGERVDARSDLYAMGVVGWELAADRDFAVTDGAAHMEALAAGKLTLPSLADQRVDVPPALDAWFAKITAVRAEERFDDATSARRALADIAHAQGLRIERDALTEVIEGIFAGERDAEDRRVQLLVATARDFHPSPTPPTVSTARQATTEPQSMTDATVLRGTRYRMGARLGAGAMGEVFAAEHMDLGRTVALKIVFADRSNDPALVQRFRLEARAIAALSHPNLVHVYDLGSTEDGRLFYAMERLVGETLREKLQREGRLTATECVRIGAAIARGLAAAHAVGVVHRDIKPENIFVTQHGGIKVLDFGVAKTTNAGILGAHGANATRAGEIFGSPGYMAPEQARGATVDARTDVYSLGALLYECAVGAGMFEGSSLVEVLARQLADTPVRPCLRAPDADIPEALDAAIMRCLAKNPETRFQSASELADTLEHLPLEVTPASVPLAPRRTSRGLLAASGIIALAVVGIVGVRGLHRDSGAPTGTVVRDHGGHDGGVTQSRPEAEDSPSRPQPPVVVAPAAHGPESVPPVGHGTVTVGTGDAGVRHDGVYRDLVSRARRALDREQNEAAIQLATQAIHAPHRGSSAEANTVLGLAYMRSGMRQRATDAWNMAIQEDPSNREARGYLEAAGVASHP